MTEANDAMHWCKINSVETDNRIAGCILVEYLCQTIWGDLVISTSALYFGNWRREHLNGLL